MIREVDPEEAEAVLTLRLFVPGVAEATEDRYYLTRRPPRSLLVVAVVGLGDVATGRKGTLFLDSLAITD